jgi:hypothetical protein
MSKVRAVAVAIGLMLCTSVAFAQFATYSPAAGGWIDVPPRRVLPEPAPGGLYVACSAEVPSQSTAYFTATFNAPAVSSARKEFRQLVTTQYGAVSQVQCVGKFNPAVVKDTVQQWQDKARATNNAIVNTDWQPTAARDQGGHYLASEGGRMKQTRAETQAFPHIDGIPGGSVPGNNSSGTVAGQSNFQR